MSSPESALELVTPCDPDSLLDRIDAVCAEFAEEQAKVESLAYRLGSLMLDVQNNPRVFLSMVNEEGRQLYRSFEEFVGSYIAPKVHRKRAMLMLYLSVVKKQFSEPEVRQLGVTTAYKIGKQLPEPTPSRALLSRTVVQEAARTGGSRREIAERAIAMRNNQPIEAVREDWLRLRGPVEDVAAARQIIEKWRTIHEVSELGVVVDVLTQAWIEGQYEKEKA